MLRHACTAVDGPRQKIVHTILTSNQLVPGLSGLLIVGLIRAKLNVRNNSN
jgi:hypothetical protein